MGNLTSMAIGFMTIVFAFAVPVLLKRKRKTILGESPFDFLVSVLIIYIFLIIISSSFLIQGYYLNNKENKKAALSMIIISLLWLLLIIDTLNKNIVFLSINWIKNKIVDIDIIKINKKMDSANTIKDFKRVISFFFKEKYAWDIDIQNFGFEKIIIILRKFENVNDNHFKKSVKENFLQNLTFYIYEHELPFEKYYELFQEVKLSKQYSNDYESWWFWLLFELFEKISEYKNKTKTQQQKMEWLAEHLIVFSKRYNDIKIKLELAYKCIESPNIITPNDAWHIQNALDLKRFSYNSNSFLMGYLVDFFHDHVPFNDENKYFQKHKIFDELILDKEKLWMIWMN